MHVNVPTSYVQLRGGQSLGSDELKAPNAGQPNPEAAEQMMAPWVQLLSHS